MLIATRSSKIDISKESSTAKFAKRFSKVLKVGDVVLLHGEIGVGKTTFVKYLINSLEKVNKVKLGEITSPTFSILNEYEINNITIRHYDLFRIRNSNDIKNIGIYEDIDNFITFIEWPEKITIKLKKKYNLYFKYNSKLNKRSLKISKKT
tara:strand:- start:11 stop:463 length:453 start_codon:yes stop_codon:yes gene_type:complete